MKRISRKRLIANRKNAQRSTGPLSPEGKARAALNAIDHGLCAKSVLMPGESDTRFRELLSSFEQDFTPQSGVARFQVEQLAIAAWRLRRSQALEVALVRDHMSTLKIHPNDKLDACTIVARAWAGSRAHLALRYENSHQRNFRHLYDRLMAVDDDGPEPEEGTRERNEPNEPGVPASGGDTTNEQTASNQPVPEENAFLRNEANAELIPTHEGSTETTPAPPPSQAHPGRHPEPGNSIT